MEQQFILTAFGKDRPGIVAQISEIIFENGCNLEDSNMGRLADEFTLILLLSGKGTGLEAKLSRDCRRLEREKDIFVFIRPLEYSIPESANGNSYHIIEVEGIDQTGIVFKISSLLADNQINIETLRSQKKFSPNSGTALYTMTIETKIPEQVSIEQLEEKLDDLSGELNVDITLS